MRFADHEGTTITGGLQRAPPALEKSKSEAKVLSSTPQKPKSDDDKSQTPAIPEPLIATAVSEKSPINKAKERPRPQRVPSSQLLREKKAEEEAKAKTLAEESKTHDATTASVKKEVQHQQALPKMELKVKRTPAEPETPPSVEPLVKPEEPKPISAPTQVEDPGKTQQQEIAQIEPKPISAPKQVEQQPSNIQPQEVALQVAPSPPAQKPGVAPAPTAPNEVCLTLTDFIAMH